MVWKRGGERRALEATAQALWSPTLLVARGSLLHTRNGAGAESLHYACWGRAAFLNLKRERSLWPSPERRAV